MFSDTHFHFSSIMERGGIDGREMLEQLARRDCRFCLDIGTKNDDLPVHQLNVEKTIAQITDYGLAQKVRNFMYFSAGIWPDVDEIKDRFNAVKKLEACINEAGSSGDQDTLHRKVVAIGEGGLDHHWNPSGTDGRCEEDFNEEIYKGERELFEMQLELAKRFNLPFIIHSRDAFEDSIDCIKNVGYHNGVVHCFSYGLAEAKAFLDLGWHIGFTGSVTYTKKAKIEEMNELLRYIPNDMLLCETDAPYLAPVPFRGQTNTPVLVEHVYNYVAQARGVTPEQLSETVDENIKKLFLKG